MPLDAGTRLGPYVVRSLLGAGGMGEVYRADDARLGRTVAIKVLPRELATPERLGRFEQEARAASALNHPNILTIHDVGRAGETAWFATEWVDGQTLRQLLRAGPIPLRRALVLAQQIADGLASAHAAGIVHRDLKPENVMVTGDGLAKIVDFGLAKLGQGAASLADQHSHTVTAGGATDPGVVMGTVGYMSPEQASGRPVDYRSDQFALGLLVYELVTRTRPFERATIAQTLAATIEDDPTPVDVANRNVPPHLGAIVSRCLAKDPAERYDSTRDLARDLKSVTETSSRHTAVAAPVSPRRALVAPLAIGAILLAAVIGAWMWRAPAPPRNTPAASEPERPLLAVRPFRSLSDDAQQAYFAAGMTEEIRGQLSQVSALRILSRDGLDRFEDDSARAVRELGIRQFVDGTVRVQGTRVRVNAELVDAEKQQTLWSQQYDRELADFLAVQADVAVQIARALQATLSPREQGRLERTPTQNPEAYSLYLQAAQMSPLSDRAKNVAGQELLRRALALDPAFAQARARLAYRLMFMSWYDSDSYIDRGLAEAEDALRSDPELPDAYFALASGYSMKGADAQARQAFLRALELDPNNVSAMNNLSAHESAFARLDESLYWARRAFGLSGKRGNDYYHVSIPLLALRADDVHRAWLLEGERRDPTMHRLQVMLALLDLWQGRTDEAVRRTARLTAASSPENEEVRLHQADIDFLTDADSLEASLRPLLGASAENFYNVAESIRLRQAYVLAKRGDAAGAATYIAEAERIARDKMAAGNQSPILRVELAAAAALRGDTAAALDWLERAFEGGQRDHGSLERDPILAPLRGHPRFKAVIDSMQRDVDAQRLRAAERGLLDLTGLVGAGG
jgi:eukaryotic-like serine/threonine-protein kinase